MNPLHIDGQLQWVLVQWLVIMAAAWAFGRLGRRLLNQPLAVGEIAAGILLGPSALGIVWPADWPVLFSAETQPILQFLGKLGLILLLFQVGMEFDYSHLKTRSRTVTMVSLLGILAPSLCGLALMPWLHDRFAPATPRLGFGLFFCLALSISALPIMGRILLERKLERTAVGVMSISAAAIDDVVGWIFLGVATLLTTTGFNSWKLLLQVAGLIAFFLLLHKAIGPWLRQLWRRQAARDRGDPMSGPFLVVLLTGLFLSCLATQALGVFVIFGAFLFGTALHQEPGLVKAWRDRFSDLVLVAFVPVFFTNTGLNTRIGSLQTEEAWLACGLVLLAAVAGKLGGCYMGARLTGQSSAHAGCIAALMNTRALMALVAINVGRELGLLTPPLFTMLVIMALLTTAMCGPLLQWWLTADANPQTAPLTPRPAPIAGAEL